MSMSSAGHLHLRRFQAQKRREVRDELDEWFERNQDATEFDGLDEFDDGEEM